MSDFRALLHIRQNAPQSPSPTFRQIRKGRGAYVSVTGVVKRIDDIDRTVVLTDGTETPVSHIYNVESECLYSFLSTKGE